tara:strand:+ start:1515 stop:1943 length:429 start_codon:yes stop_codon:yes gene_type:complete
VKKKYTVSNKDKKDWITFTKQIGNLSIKDKPLVVKNSVKNSALKLDLHGFSLEEANKKVKKFIIESYKKGHKKLLIVTGKGSRSKLYDNPYISQKFSLLKYSIPEFINRDEDLYKKINKINQASLRDGGEGAFYIFLKKIKE